MTNIDRGSKGLEVHPEIARPIQSTPDAPFWNVEPPEPPGPTVPTIVAWSMASSGAADAAEVVCPALSGVEAGDLLLAFSTTDYSSSNYTRTPSGFTEIGQIRAYDSAVCGWHKVATGPQGTLTVPNTGSAGSGRRLVAYHVALRGIAAVSPIDSYQTSVLNGGGVPALPYPGPSTTLSVANCMAISCFAHDGSDGHPFVIDTAGWTLLNSTGTDGGSAGGLSAAIGWRLFASSGSSGSPDFEGGSSDGNSGITVAIKPVGA